jgi:uncharacterized protein (DUF2062 family)
LKYTRFPRYYFLKMIRLKGEPHELALGMAIGILCAMLPILPFHIALAVALALFFKASKITAVIGCFASNPFNWYILYFMNYKIGTSVLGLSGDDKGFSSIMGHVFESEGALEVITRLISSSGIIIAAFIIGGLLMGAAASIPAYFIFLKVFSLIKDWRIKRRSKKDAGLKKN